MQATLATVADPNRVQWLPEYAVALVFAPSDALRGHEVLDIVVADGAAALTHRCAFYSTSRMLSCCLAQRPPRTHLLSW